MRVGVLDRNMKIVSVAPMPSRMGTPKRSWKAVQISAGRRSPAEMHSRTDLKVSAGRSARSRRA
jgi:hypothetical protein